VGLALAFSTHNAHAADKVSFNRDIRPIFSDICFTCHGPDVSKMKGGLRLDTKETAMKGGDSGPAIVPGKAEESEVFKRLITHDAEDIMPPKKFGKTLNTAQIETVRRWIAEGAEYQGHWAFIKPERPPVPGVKNPIGKIQNPIDAFVLARLEKEGLKPQPEAPKETLIRRVSLDLTGIPPTPAEVDAFLADKSPDAYGKVVDRLLSSPRYGEQMAVRWLDLARYADSNGFQTDSSRQQWHWRDWVIRAFNRNMPFDEFTIEQLGGDLLPPVAGSPGATRDQIVATGFNRNHRLNGEGGRIVEEWFAETVIDRVETTGLTWMALTLNCCRCHDHKYDPIKQKEFYQLFAFFNSNKETGVLEGGNRNGGNTPPTIPLPTPEEEAKLATLDAAVKDAEKRVAAAEKELPALQATWERTFVREMKASASPWTPLETTVVKSIGGATLTRQPDGSWLAGGSNPANDTYEIEANLASGQFTGLLLEVFPDPSLPGQSLGRSSNGNFVLSNLEVEVNVPGGNAPIEAEFTRVESSYDQKGWEAALIGINQPKPAKGRPAKGKAAKKAPQNKPGWAVDGNDPAKRLPRKALFVCDPITVPKGATLTVRLIHGSPFADHNIGRFRLSATAFPPSMVKLEGGKIPDVVLAALKAEPARRTPEQARELTKFYRENTGNPAKKAEAALAAANKAREAAEQGVSTTMVMQEIPQPRVAHVLVRGEYDKPGDVVPRALPAVMPPLPAGAPNNRLGLARWLVSGEHPLTARVWVNREWERFFGTGLVKTSENLGSQAEWPSHPELLDWLAVEFARGSSADRIVRVTKPWDMKAMQKLIVMSATYRQSSRVTPEVLAKDPENRLLARGPRFRLGAEALRDQALAVSGLLVEKIGGPSVKPYMPVAVWDETSVYGDMRNYKEDTGESLYRRTLYTIWKRTAAPPSMMLFDSPSREICTVKRSRTNTPLQALTLLNEVTYIEAARSLAQRMIAEGGSKPEERIAWAFRLATCRAPRPDEVNVLAAGLAKRLARFRQSPAEAAKILAVGESKADARFNPVELAAYTSTANVLLNLDEVVTRE